MSSIGRDGATADIASDTPASGTAVAVWTLVVLILPGLGVILAAVLAFTALRHNRVARWVLLGLSIAMIAFVLVGLYGPTSVEGDSGPPQRVT